MREIFKKSEEENGLFRGVRRVVIQAVREGVRERAGTPDRALPHSCHTPTLLVTLTLTFSSHS